jgi:glycosyltransferase involved in cell wall biosynthesis
VTAARLSREKGLAVLIAAWRRRPRNAVLHIAGSGSDEHTLRSLAAGDASIRFEGQLPLPRLMELTSKARALVHPCLWMEPFGRTPMEGFSVGTPAIVSRVGGLVETVEHGRNGLLVEPGDADGLDQAIHTLLADDEAFARMSRGALETFAERFSPDAMLKATETIYESALRRRGCIPRAAA